MLFTVYSVDKKILYCTMYHGRFICNLHLVIPPQTEPKKLK
jgi:hypothetical protein